VLHAAVLKIVFLGVKASGEPLMQVRAVVIRGHEEAHRSMRR